MASVKATREVGDTPRFEEEVKEFTPFDSEGSLVDPDTITITISKYDGTKVVDSESMQKHATGQYFYNWDTQGLEATEYKVEIVAVKGDIEEKSEYFVELTE